MIEIKEIKKFYGDVAALKGVSFRIQTGEIVGLLGPNGAGKTTLMKIMTGYLYPSEGKASVGGFDVLEEALELQKIIGYLPENAPLYLEMTVQDYLVYIARLRQMMEQDILGALKKAVERAGLKEMLTRPIHTLSKGYRQRVGIAQAIIHQPKILILDEPTNGLDPRQIIEIRELIKSLAREATVILSSHILSEVQLTCERILMIHRGELRLDQDLSHLSQGVQVLVEIHQRFQKEAQKKILALPDVKTVEFLGATEAYCRLLVEAQSEKKGPLNRQLFSLARENDWLLQEIHRKKKNLEEVFQEIASS
jgi:ABC-2 type transport system ATP-binding protein